jgi:hypothetical protein
MLRSWISYLEKEILNLLQVFKNSYRGTYPIPF